MVSEAFNEGYKSFMDGKSVGANPYQIGSTEYGDWLNGYNAAEEELASEE